MNPLFKMTGMFSTVTRLVTVSALTGILSLGISGCKSSPPMQSMAPGPTEDHGFPGVSVTGDSTQWPPRHLPDQAQVHRIYSQTMPRLPVAPRPDRKSAAIPALSTIATPAAASTRSTGPALQRSVYFAFNSARLSYWDEVVLDKLADSVKTAPNKTIRLYGSTDPLGSESYNKKLGYRRSLSVKHYLVSRGIPEQRLKAFSWGDKKARTFSSCRKRSTLCPSQSRSVRISISSGVH